MPAGSRVLLERFPEAERSAVANLFLDQVRAGAASPPDVVARAFTEARRRYDEAMQSAPHAEVARAHAIVQALAAHPSEALAFAQWWLGWQALPPAERHRIKSIRSAAQRQRWLEQQPATERQLRYLQALGYEGPVTSKWHASQLIDELTGGQP